MHNIKQWKESETALRGVIMDSYQHRKKHPFVNVA
jgi:hypothetical protein